MLRYILLRLLNAVVVVIGVSLLVFVLTRAVGNPVNTMLPMQATAEERARMTHALGLDKPLWDQLVEYSAGAVRGDFGKSWWQGLPALQVAMERFPFTFQLSGLAFVLSLVFAIPLGILSALRPRSALDKFTSTISMLGVCVPNFWLGLMLILVFANTLHWLPTSGTGDWKYMVLPVVTLAVLPLGRITLIVRSSMMEQLRSLYVITARSKGLAEWVVVTKHALKNAGITVVTMAGWELGRMLAGYTVVIETVFGLPGIGSLIIDAINLQDFPLLQALTFLIAIVISLLNLCIDLTYPLFNPRLQLE